MDNQTRSRRTRALVLEAALAVIQRDGPGRLTLDAVARESGLSKGGLMHQFRTKEAVVRALLDHQIAYFEAFGRDLLLEAGADMPEPRLAAEIATARETAGMRRPVALAILGASASDPALLSAVRDKAAQKLETLRAEAADPDLATIRWLAARGLALSVLLGICPMAPEERERLFARLLDPGRWQAPPAP
ncbi:TetR/AcrR family transcriptional regulator [Belnapia rosea]|uniref:Transcriptional regulator, TetR family n=1 Tax=Belnapia rosea TaxID=938405 RepID=A0A1G6W6Y2_9PROT|nr:TetR/AcrR family transcriptional regulator [Belnapia rosea]SDD61568.1 transcriptional regulator, TetR family [Belnapia rosea]